MFCHQTPRVARCHREFNGISVSPPTGTSQPITPPTALACNALGNRTEYLERPSGESSVRSNALSSLVQQLLERYFHQARSLSMQPTQRQWHLPLHLWGCADLKHLCVTLHRPHAPCLATCSPVCSPPCTISVFQLVFMFTCRRRPRPDPKFDVVALVASPRVARVPSLLVIHHRRMRRTTRSPLCHAIRSQHDTSSLTLRWSHHHLNIQPSPSRIK